MNTAVSSTGLPALYRQHHSWLRGWLRVRLNNRDDAADLAHDAFVRLLQASAAHEVAPLREPRAYLATIAKNLLLNHRRRRALEEAWLNALAAVPEAHAPSPEDQLAIWQTLARVDAVLARLSAPARHAFLLAQVEGLTYAEIAQRLGVTERSVRRYMAQAYEHCILHAD